jgi:hypothetical protein
VSMFFTPTDELNCVAGVTAPAGAIELAPSHSVCPVVFVGQSWGYSPGTCT